MKRLNREQLVNRVNLVKEAFNRDGSYYELQMGQVFIAKKFMTGYRKTSYTQDGYGYFGLYSRSEKRDFNIYIHHMVLILHDEKEYINRMAEGMTVNHISGDKTDNSLTNLEYLTQSDNTIHAYNLGLGSKPLEAVITEYDAYEMLEKFHESKVSLTELAVQFNIPSGSVKRIVKGQVYTGLFVMYRTLNKLNDDRKMPSKLTVQKVKEVLKAYYLDDMKQKDIASTFNVSRSAIGMVVSGQRWSEVYRDFIEENKKEITGRA